MNKQQRKIRELRARFVTKLTKQAKILRALDYMRTSGDCLIDITLRKKEEKWVDTYNKWYQFVGRNPKQAADEIRLMPVSQKNKFYFWLTHEYVLLNPYGNHFDEKFCMMVFVLSKPKTMANFLNNYAQLRSSFTTMQYTVDFGTPGSWEEAFFLADCEGTTRRRLNLQPDPEALEYLKAELTDN